MKKFKTLTKEEYFAKFSDVEVITDYDTVLDILVHRRYCVKCREKLSETMNGNWYCENCDTYYEDIRKD